MSVATVHGNATGVLGDGARLLPVDVTGYAPHPLHAGERVWAQTNCSVDLWIEVLHAAGLDPVPALSVALEADFVRWDWSRAALGDKGRAAVLYDVQRRTGEPLSLALAFDADGVGEPFEPPPRIALPGTAWRVPRSTRSDDAGATRVHRTLEDTPFYARSLIDTHLLGAPVQAVHESLSLDRFDRAWCQLMLPFRMPRLAGR